MGASSTVGQAAPEPWREPHDGHAWAERAGYCPGGAVGRRWGSLDEERGNDWLPWRRSLITAVTLSIMLKAAHFVNPEG